VSVGTAFALKLFRLRLFNVLLIPSAGETWKEMDRMMRNRRHTLLWMKDLLDHMNQCHEQLQWASDGRTEAYLAETLLVDLTECQKLCQQLKPHSREATIATASV
jgi:hypothetical protein